MMTAEEEVWRGEVTNELRHIVENVKEIRREVGEVHEIVHNEIAEHRAYHEQNEHKWGAARWCEKHPFRLAALLATLLTCSAVGNTVENWPALVKAIIELFP